MGDEVCAVCSRFGLSCDEVEALLTKLSKQRLQLQGEMTKIREKADKKETELSGLAADLRQRLGEANAKLLASEKALVAARALRSAVGDSPAPLAPPPTLPSRKRRPSLSPSHIEAAKKVAPPVPKLEYTVFKHSQRWGARLPNLHKAVHNNNLSDLNAALLAAPSEINRAISLAVDEDFEFRGVTPLHLAVDSCNEGAVRYLLGQGARTDLRFTEYDRAFGFSGDDELSFGAPVGSEGESEAEFLEHQKGKTAVDLARGNKMMRAIFEQVVGTATPAKKKASASAAAAAAPAAAPASASSKVAPTKGEIKATRSILKGYRNALTNPIELRTPGGDTLNVLVEHEFLHVHDETRLEWNATFHGDNRTTNIASLHHTLVKLGVRPQATSGSPNLGTKEIKKGIVVASMGTSSTQVYSSAGVIGAFYLGTGAFTTYSATKAQLTNLTGNILQRLEDQQGEGILPVRTAVVFISAIGYFVAQDLRLDGASQSILFDRKGESVAAAADPANDVRWQAGVSCDDTMKRRLTQAISTVDLSASKAALDDWMVRHGGTIDGMAKRSDARGRVFHRQLLHQRAKLQAQVRKDQANIEGAAGALMGMLEAAASVNPPFQIVVKKRGNIRIQNSWGIEDHGGDSGNGAAAADDDGALRGRFMVDLGGGGPCLTFAGSMTRGVQDIGKSRMLRGRQAVFVEEVLNAGKALTSAQKGDSQVAGYLFTRASCIPPAPSAARAATRTVCTIAPAHALCLHASCIHRRCVACNRHGTAVRPNAPLR